MTGRMSALALGVMAAACGGLHGPAPDPKEHVRGEHYRLVPEAPDRLWSALQAAVTADGFQIRRSDPRRHVLELRERYRGRDAVKRLADISDLAAARREGLRTVSEYSVTYRLFLMPGGAATTSLKITSAIQAIDRSQVLWIEGAVQPFTRFIDVPSRGVAERELMRRLGASLFTAEEMLLLVGELGVD
jgi:hypothetical protein